MDERVVDVIPDGPEEFDDDVVRMDVGHTQLPRTRHVVPVVHATCHVLYRPRLI